MPAVLSLFQTCTGPVYPEVSILTDLGEIRLELYSKEAPLTAENFMKLIAEGAYDSARFYRVVRMDNQPDDTVKIEVIQGGLFSMEKISGHPLIMHETTASSGIRHRDGVLSMARNEPGSASTEFFICIGDQPELDFSGSRNPDGQGFAAFGKITAGMDIVRQIQSMPDTNQILKDPVGIINMKITP